MSIRSKLLIFALSISLVPISIITILYYFNARSAIELQAMNWLTAVAESKKIHTISFLDSKKGRVVDFSSDGFIRDSLEIISRLGDEGDAVSNLNQHIKMSKKSLDSQIAAIAVLDINGMVIASTTEEWDGIDMSKEDVFVNCLSKDYGETYTGKKYSFPYLNSNCILFSAPLTSKHDSKTIGVIINAYKIEILSGITNKRMGMGETGETLLGMKAGDSVVFLTTQKLAPGKPLSISFPLDSSGAEPMRLALKGRTGAIIAPDYRGIDVVAAYQYIPDMEWGLVTKLDEDEVFLPITHLRIFTIILGIISTIAVVVIAFILTRRVTNPVRKLVEGTQRISSGDLDFKIFTSSKDEIGALAASFNDMTFQLRETKKQLNNYAQNLEKMVEDKTKEIKLVLNELKYRNEEMEQIIYVTSHDLRSPLLNIQGFSKELQKSMEKIRIILNGRGISKEIREKISGTLDDDIPEALKFILTSSSKMDQLLSGLLKISRMSRMVLKRKPLNMNKLISNVIETYEYRVKKANVKILQNDLPLCNGDDVQINQAFSNLLDNALNYADCNREGIIKISGRKEGGYNIYCIEDNGIGIEEKHYEKIFEIFYRVDPRNSVAGEGLGLTNVRRIIDRHGGKIWIESEWGKGTRFYVSLPDSTNV